MEDPVLGTTIVGKVPIAEAPPPTPAVVSRRLGAMPMAENMERADLSFPPWTPLIMNEPNLPAQKSVVPVLPRTSV